MFHDERRGVWRAQWTRDGKRHSKSFRCPKEAMLHELKAKSGEIPSLPARTPTNFEALAAKWLAEYSKVEKAPAAWIDDKAIIETHLTPAFGEVPVDKLRRHHLMALKAAMAGKVAKGKKTQVLKPRTVNNVLAVAKRILAWAAELELVPANPFAGVRPLKVPEDEFQFWTLEDHDAFRRKARPLDPEFTDLVTVLFFTGLRRGEAAALRREDLDFERGMITVGGSFNLKLGRRVPTKTKTIGRVEMTSVVRQVLGPKRFLKKGEPVFPTALFQNARRRFRNLCQETGLRAIRVHDLRHSFASNLAIRGVDLMVIQKLLRHKSYVMTLRYAHLHPSALTGAAEVLCTQTARTPVEESSSARKAPESEWGLTGSNCRPSVCKGIA